MYSQMQVGEVLVVGLLLRVCW